MNNDMDNDGKFTKEQVIDIAKAILSVLFVLVASFAYWMFVLLLISLFLVNVWKVKFEQIVIYALFLMALTTIVYVGRKLYKRMH